MAEGHEHSKQVVQIEQVKQGEQLVHKHVDTPQELYLHLVPHAQEKPKTTTTKTKTTTTKKTTKPASVKAAPVLTEKEMGRMIDMGLGRGVDATDPSPWVSKSSFQVRRVTFDSVIGTEEGGALQSYEREISSVQTQQADLKASIAIPQAPFTIGVDAEHSRSVSTTRRAVGKKVINRTISFRADFEDLPQSTTTDPRTARRQAIPSSLAYDTSEEESYRDVADAQCDLTFEERLAKWILERLRYKEEVEGRLGDHEEEATGNPLDDLAAVIQKSTTEQLKTILSACREFVQYFRVTHYVSAIELGASEYRVLSETEYFSRIKTGGTFGLEALANVAISQSASWKKTKKASDLKRIGRIVYDLVQRGTYDEAVVGVSIQPICSLVRLRYLQLTLKKALLEYVDTQGDSTAGPYLIACNDDRIFWTVNPDNNYAVEATRDIGHASAFFVFPNEDGGHPYEFIIGYYGDSRKVLKRTKSILTSTPVTEKDPIPRYLHTPVNKIGRNSGPLHLKNHVLQTESRLTLHSRLLRDYNPVDITPWVDGRDMFFINCSRRRFRVDGYICVKSVSRGGRPVLRTACVASKTSHNERNTWMLFRLLPISLRDQPAVTAGGRNEPDALSDVDVELERYGVLDDAPKPRKGSREAAVQFELGSDTSKLLPRTSGERRLDTTAESTIPAGDPVELPELAGQQSTDISQVKYGNSRV